MSSPTETTRPTAAPQRDQGDWRKVGTNLAALQRIVTRRDGARLAAVLAKRPKPRRATGLE